MNDASRQNKAAWEFDAYAFWCRHNGPPDAFAAVITADPRAALRRFDEHPAWDDPSLPGEFTLPADFPAAERTNL